MHEAGLVPPSCIKPPAIGAACCCTSAVCALAQIEAVPALLRCAFLTIHSLGQLKLANMADIPITEPGKPLHLCLAAKLHVHTRPALHFCIEPGTCECAHEAC